MKRCGQKYGLSKKILKRAVQETRLPALAERIVHEELDSSWSGVLESVRHADGSRKEQAMVTRQRTGGIATLILFIGIGASAHAQSSSAPSRASLLEASRRAQVQTIEPSDRSTIEKGLNKFDDAMLFLGKVQRGWNGVRFAGGDFPSGAGFNFGIGFTDNAVGAVYEDLDMPNRLDVNFVAATSTRSYHQLSGDVAFRNIGGSILNFAARGKWYEHPEEDFFGLGPDSEEGDRTSYLERGLEFGVDLWLEPVRGLRIGGGAAWMNPRIGSGEDPRFPSTDELFDPSTIPGFQNPPEFVRLGGTVSFDWRDKPLRPRAGGFYGVKLSNYKDQATGSFDFRQYEFDVQQYIPWMNRFRVLALRANVVISDVDAGNEVPFFYMPHLGGGELLRGFREFRFRDRNSILLSAEYRWEAWWPLEMALFVDAGKVAARRSDIDFHNLEVSYGLGFRFHSVKAVSLRLDLAFSREGFIPLLRYSHVF